MLVAMNSTLQKLLPAIERWPDEDQEALAEAAREIEALRTGLYAMSSDEEAAVAEGLAQAKRGQFANDDRIAELWKRAGS
jgi:predicted transcriptional regulator